MARILAGTGTLGLLLSVLLASGCAEDEGAAAQAAEERSREVALAERDTLPTEIETGDPILILDGVLPDHLNVAFDGGACDDPLVDARVRAQRGGTCSTFQAEVSAWIGRCVGTCDEAALTLQTIRLAAAECSRWCSSNSCGQRVTFIPPPDGCNGSDCYQRRETCPDPDCPNREYCSLIGGRAVWNCFSRDLIPV